MLLRLDDIVCLCLWHESVAISATGDSDTDKEHEDNGLAVLLEFLPAILTDLRASLVPHFVALLTALTGQLNRPHLSPRALTTTLSGLSALVRTVVPSTVDSQAMDDAHDRLARTHSTILASLPRPNVPQQMQPSTAEVWGFSYALVMACKTVTSSLHSAAASPVSLFLAHLFDASGDIVQRLLVLLRRVLTALTHHCAQASAEDTATNKPASGFAPLATMLANRLAEALPDRQAALNNLGVAGMVLAVRGGSRWTKSHITELARHTISIAARSINSNPYVHRSRISPRSRFRSPDRPHATRSVYVACRVANLTPGEMLSLVKGATGHPKNATKSINWLFFCGLRGHETFPVLAIERLSSRTQSRVAKAPHRAPLITGPARALFGLVTALRQIRAPSGLDQTRVPFSQRKPTFSIRYFTVGVPYHSEYLAGATRKVFDTDLDGQELWTADDLVIPVYHTETETSLTQLLCDQIFTLLIHCSKATAIPEDATHAIDFGPGALSGIGGLTARNWEGRGIRTIVIGDKGKGDLELYRASHVHDGKLQLDMPFSRLFGAAYGDMTPSTVKGGFESAVLSGGYHIELAGGGHHNATALRSKVAEIQANVPAGTGLTLNALYITRGIPIEGFCVAAGIPSIEKAGEIIDGLRSAGIRHVFKPGSVDGIRQVVNIAAAHLDFPIILQWTGGRAGGHHSCEDFHQPMLSTYVSIRQHANIILVGGSGFGCSEDGPPMPFNGFLFASRVMVAKEAYTSRSVKELIVAVAGVSDSQWEGTYAKETGGILTVTSELGEPIHKIATRGVKLWKELDDTVFALPKEKRAAWLKEKHDYIVKRLNADFQEPWFCSRKDGTVVREVGDMTYEDVARRLVRLMFVAHEGRWIDITLRNLVGDWLRRAEERFAGIDHTDYKTSEIQSYSELDDPLPYLDKFFSLYSDATKQLVCSEDAAYFLAIAQRPGQKPVPFIPVLDADFGVWFKKDSLWQSEDIEAVFDQDPQRVCILQGPVAVKHANVVDEPIANIFGNIDSALVKKILDRFYDGNASNVPEVDYVGAQSSREATFPAGVERELTAGVTKYKIGSTVPPVNDWLDVLASQSFGWLRAFLTTPNIVQGSSYVANPIRRLFAPRANQEGVEACYNATARRISLTIFEERTCASVPLHLVYNYRPDQGFAPVHEVLDFRNKSIKQFYWKLWFGDSEELPELNVREVFTSPEVTIGAQEIETFCAIIGNDGEAFKRSRNSTMQAPMDFSIVAGWKAIMQAIFPTTINGDLLRIVHLTNGFRLLNGARPLQLGDTCQAKARIVSVVNSDSGKTVKVKGYIIRDGQHVMEVTSSFLYRGRFTDYVNSFEVVDEDMYEVEYATDAAVGMLQSKEWFEYHVHPIV
ncbi:hypothetical protein BKA62DRAFT_761063 [Auriculariales sp. MPI-PUGE-AT-0066]|nr:hypothetical protein BKA62DRAFT_761063 [Auriculariales sp. MPI-PUGE-AT-0066]